MKIKKNPIVGGVLGIGFMILGILTISYPELTGAISVGGRSFAILGGLLLLLLGLAQFLYIIVYRRMK